MRILIIAIILTLSSCVVSQKVFDKEVLNLQNQIDSKLPIFEFELKERIIRESIKKLHVKVDTNSIVIDTLKSE